MIHAPIDIKNRFDQYKALEKLKDIGLIINLGVVNISLMQLMTILKNSDKIPSVFEVLKFYFCFIGIYINIDGS